MVSPAAWFLEYGPWGPSGQRAGNGGMGWLTAAGAGIAPHGHRTQAGARKLAPLRREKRLEEKDSDKKKFPLKTLQKWHMFRVVIWQPRGNMPGCGSRACEGSERRPAWQPAERSRSPRQRDGSDDRLSRICKREQFSWNFTRKPRDTTHACVARRASRSLSSPSPHPRIVSTFLANWGVCAPLRAGWGMTPSPLGVMQSVSSPIRRALPATPAPASFPKATWHGWLRQQG